MTTPFSFVPPHKAEMPYTISEINQGVSSIIEAGNTLLWVEGELSNFKRAASGHCYLKLKDESSQIPAVIWKNIAEQLTFEPEDGMQIVAVASLRVYTRGGYYQLDVHKAQPAGLGALFAAFEKLKKKLQAEGLFDHARKRPLPPRVERLGVITSKKGAALHDIVTVTWSRSRRIDIVLIDVPVQGEHAAAAIVNAVRDMNAYGNVDCIIVGRGGGSIEDLWAFNEEAVARAIAASKLPVISAVGHEIDFTIADFVADARASTPSAAAEMTIADDEQNRRYFFSRAQYALRRFIRYFSERQNAFQRLLQRKALKRAPRTIADARQTLDELRRRSARAALVALRHSRERFSRAASQLRALGPVQTMARGFSIVAKADGTTIKDAGQTIDGERVAIHFYKGKARADIVGRFE